MFENKKAFQSLIDQNGLKFVRIVFQFFHTDCLVPLDHTGDIEMKSQQNVINPTHNFIRKDTTCRIFKVTGNRFDNPRSILTF